MGRLEGKIAVITGAGTGMGRACMQIFAREGAVVVGAGRRPERLDEVVSQIEADDGRALAVPTDVSVEAECERLIEAARSRFGRVDVLVNNAAMGGSAYGALRKRGMAGLAETPTEYWMELIGNNLHSVYFMIKHVIPVMRDQGGGSIVNVASISAFKGISVAHGYNAAKAAIVKITRDVAVTYGRYGIRANTICPGSTDTPMMEGAVPGPNDERAKAELCPLGRVGTPGDMAYGCLYFASDEASYVSGAELVIDGGGLAHPT